MVTLLLMPVVGQLTTKFQARRIIGFGWLCLSAAMYLSTQRIDLLISFRSAVWLRVAQVGGLGFLFVPITLAAYVGIPQEKSNAVAGMINFMRNIGSSVGTSMVTTLIARRSQFHQLMLSGDTAYGRQNFEIAVNGLITRLTRFGISAHDAQTKAYAFVYGAVQSQAATLAYIDTYWILCVGAGVMFVLSFFLKKNDPGAGGESAAL
jgi:DHA2 family multidrug resistance protein